jgi:hypothetical protein
MKILGKEAGGVGFKKALNDLVASPAYKALLKTRGSGTTSRSSRRRSSWCTTA